ncbi:helix-turn-helix domain-containing protein [Haloarchaeobius sp. HME9146]|uniref:winged helix-turn-helix domain-containing protein n=1 Tax=Haloarchaeobius sp. HME9146 TaxID=2978732 RepID=UPI0021BE24F7|nr:helix-turn-helix domain-containing protein [Haloarchaeobius sp. HME9146]MCT9098450.1 helix-turn-helix domain-containing protein [Haloarchaeobius sp. HME9146]
MSKTGAKEGSAVRPETAFSLLGNETRFGILKALWEISEPLASKPVSYSNLMDEVGVRDSGNFNYHLGKLEGHFVRSLDDGYELTAAGEQIVQTVVAGTGVEHPSMEEQHVGVVCAVCGGTETTVQYDDEILTLRCTECPGSYPTPPGKLAAFQIPPAGLTDRTPREIFEVGIARVALKTQSMIEGICPTCSMEPTIDVKLYDEHMDHDEPAEFEDTMWAIAYYGCPRCKLTWRFPTWATVMWHPAVISFFYQRKPDIDPLSWEYFVRGREFDQELVSEDPIRIAITVRYGDDGLQLTYDESMAVVDIDPEPL